MPTSGIKDVEILSCGSTTTLGASVCEWVQVSTCDGLSVLASVCSVWVYFMNLCQKQERCQYYMADCESENMHCDQKRKRYFDYMKRLWPQRWLRRSVSSMETQCASPSFKTVGLTEFTWHGLEWYKLTWQHDQKVKWPLPALNNNEWDLPAA